MKVLEKTFSSLTIAAALMSINSGCKVNPTPQDIDKQPVVEEAIATQKVVLKSVINVSDFSTQTCKITDNGVECSSDVNIRNDGVSSYLTFDVLTEPFKLDKASLILDIQFPQELIGQFYVKCKNAYDQSVVSFYTPNDLPYTPLKFPPSHAMLTAGKSKNGFKWFANDISGNIDDDIVKIEFDALVIKNGTATIKCSNLEIGGVAPTMKKITVNDYGMTTRTGTHRGTYATKNADGNDTVVMWLMDDINRRNLQIDVETGECVVVPLPPTNTPDAVYSSIMSKDERIYSLVGRHMLEYDPKSIAFTADYECPHPVAMSMAEGADGTIWAASYPDGGLVSFNPQTRIFTDYGCINSENWAQYPRTTVAHTDGWVYVGIGSTNGQVVAYNPTERKAIPLMDAAHRPNPSTYNIYTYSDGNVYALSDGPNAFMFRLENGTATLLDKAPDAKPVPQHTGTQYYVQNVFPSGRLLKSFQETDMRIVTTDSDGNNEKITTFSYPPSYGYMIAVDVTEDGVFGGGGDFPFRFGTVDLVTGERIEQFCDDQCNTIITHGKYFYIGGYSGGQLMRFDPRKPWTLDKPMSQTEPNFETNPIFYGKANPVINRPHAIAFTPEGDKFIVGGTPEYGMTGGGLAIVNINTNEVEIIGHEKLAEYEAPYSIAAIGNGKLVVGTTISPGTGGAVKTQGASIFVYDMNAKKVLWKAKYGNGNLYSVNALIATDDGMVFGLANDEMFIFDPVNFKFVKKTPLGNYGGYIGIQGPRILHKDENGNIYAAFAAGLCKIDTQKCAVSKFLQIPGGIEVGGGIYKNSFYYSSAQHLKGISLEYFDESEDE